MTDQPRGPIRGFWQGCLLALGGCVALWLAVQLLAQIWMWLLVAVLVIAVVFFGRAVLRWRRSRW